MNGFLRSYRIKGNDKEDYKTFLDNNKNIVNTFIKIQNKPIKNKFIKRTRRCCLLLLIFSLQNRGKYRLTVRKSCR